MTKTDYRDDWGNVMAYCNSCGEEAEEYTECCDDGEVVHHDDCDCEECA
jgi:thymidine kinase